MEGWCVISWGWFVNLSNQPHTFNWRIIPQPLFSLYYCPPWNFQSKVTKMPRHIHNSNPMKTWSPHLYSPYILPAHRTTICRMKNVYFYGLKLLFPTLFLLRAQQNVTTPLKIITKRRRFKTTLLHSNRANTLWDREGSESSLRPNQPRSPLSVESWKARVTTKTMPVPHFFQ